MVQQTNTTAEPQAQPGKAVKKSEIKAQQKALEAKLMNSMKHNNLKEELQSIFEPLEKVNAV